MHEFLDFNYFLFLNTFCFLRHSFLLKTNGSADAQLQSTEDGIYETKVYICHIIYIYIYTQYVINADVH